MLKTWATEFKPQYVTDSIGMPVSVEKFMTMQEAMSTGFVCRSSADGTTESMAVSDQELEAMHAAAEDAARSVDAEIIKHLKMSPTYGVTLPDYLTKTTSLAKMIYDFWVTSMDSDKVNHMFADSWEGLGEEERRHFAEAIQVNVTEPLKKFYSPTSDVTQKAAPEVEVDFSDIEDKPTVATKACYACGRRPSRADSLTCDWCK